MFVPRPEWAQGSAEALEREITELSAHIQAATCRWLCLVAEFDRRDGWVASGCRSCAAWLSWRCGLAPSGAREQVRVARRLAEMPRVLEAFGRGELSYSQVRALSRVVNEDTEEQFLNLARHCTAADLEVLVRSYRGVLAAELPAVRRSRQNRYVVCSHDEDGSLTLHARLPAEEGAIVLAALAAGRDALRSSADETASAEAPQASDSAENASAEAPSTPEGVSRPAATDADALVLMADTLVSSGAADRPGGERYQVVVHVDADAVGARDDEAGRCELDHGAALHPETARRLACDASLVRVLERDGQPLSIGRKTRSVPPSLRRALNGRDGGCRFPGCDQRRFVDAHHIHHWARGGRTDLGNLVLLCRHHHRLVHEGEFSVEARPRGRLVFRRPDGRVLPAVPAPRRGDLHELRRRNRRAGLSIDDKTGEPDWYGDPLDLDYAVGGLADSDERLRPGRGPPS
jgi:hypothetical protein